MTENGSRITYAHLTQRHFQDIRVATQYLQGRNAPRTRPARLARASLRERRRDSRESCRFLRLLPYDIT